MKKSYLIVALGVLTAIITCPVLADSIVDATQAKLKFSDAKQDEQNEEQSKKASSSTLIDGDAEEKSVDCFYSENATDPLCKK